MAKFDRLLDMDLPQTDASNGICEDPHAKQTVSEGVDEIPSVSITDSADSSKGLVNAHMSPKYSKPVENNEVISVIAFQKENRMAPYGYEENSVAPWTPGQTIALICILGIIILFCAHFLKDTLRGVAETQSMNARNRLLETEQRKEYAALESDVVQAIRMIDERISRLDAANQSIAHEVEELIGVSIRQVMLNPKERPVELNEAIYQSRTFASSWATLCNAVATAYPPTTYRHKLDGVQTRIKEKRLISADRNELYEVQVYLDTEEQLSQERFSTIRRLIDEINARRLEKDLRAFERNI